MEIDKGTSRARGQAELPPQSADNEDGRAGGRRPQSPIEFRLDPTSGVPTYLQLVQQVEQALRLGYLKPGDQLPRVREVVASLAINPNTVLKAYRELETKGLATGRPGQGTFIQATLTQIALAGTDRAAPLPARLAGDRRRSRAGRGWDRRVVHQHAAGFQGTARSLRRPSWPGGRRLGGRRVNVIETHGLDKCYGSTWALRECTMADPRGACGRTGRPERRR